MIEVEPGNVDGMPVMTVRGRLDSYGASVFDQAASSFQKGGAEDLIVDLTAVEYLSSMGVRSLVRLEKSLIGKSGGVILVGMSPFLVQVLDQCGLLKQFRAAETLDAALAAARRLKMADDGAARKCIHGREYMIRPLSGQESKIDLWGRFPLPSDRDLAAQDLVALDLETLGPGFGIGGFGEDRSRAAAGLGVFAALGRIAGVVPADGKCLSDFIITERPALSTIYAAAAMGVSGAPAFLVDADFVKEVTLGDLLGDVFAVIPGSDGTTPSMLGMVLFAECTEIRRSWFAARSDICASRYEKDRAVAKGLLMVAVAVEEPTPARPREDLPPGFLAATETYHLVGGRRFRGHGFCIHALKMRELTSDLDENIRLFSDPERLEGAGRVEPETRVSAVKGWIFVTTAVRSGAEKCLGMEVMDPEDFPDEWEIITRRIFSDAARVVLKPIHGGFMSKTFHVTSYGGDGRRMIPRVLKIGPLDLTRREEIAYQNYVEKYILNNSTTIMGTASQGNWAGLCYNFLGIEGPECKLSWLARHYRERPAEELIPLFERIFTSILKPWHGQPRWEEIFPYAEHNPLRLFPAILEDAERVLGISPDEVSLCCPELGTTLANPFRFLKHEYPAREGYSRLWYRSVTHGDLNMQNILLDERENIYIIDFSETRYRNVLSDYARLEPILKIEMTALVNEEDLKGLLEFEKGLCSASALNETPAFTYHGSDRMVEKAYRVICKLRGYADTVTLFETDLIPYLLALLEWTYPVVSYRNASLLQKKYAAYSAGMLVGKIMELAS